MPIAVIVNAGPEFIVKSISRSASFCVSLFDLYKSAVTLAPIGYPPKSPIKTGMNPSGFILKNFVVSLPKNFEIRLNDFEDAMYEDKTKNGKREGIIVESRRVIPFFIPLLAVSGFMIIRAIKMKVHKIFGRCVSRFLKCDFNKYHHAITLEFNIFYEV